MPTRNRDPTSVSTSATSTADVGNTSRGKKILVTSVELEVSDVAANRSAEAKKFHASNPVKAYSGYGTPVSIDDLIRQGKVRYIGTSTFAAWQLTESLWAAKELGLNRFVCEQPPYNLLDRRIERELLPFCRTYPNRTLSLPRASSAARPSSWIRVSCAKRSANASQS